MKALKIRREHKREQPGRIRPAFWKIIVRPLFSDNFGFNKINIICLLELITKSN